MKPLLLTVGNIYIDLNVFGVNSGGKFRLESGMDYFAESSERVLGGSAVNVAMQALRLGISVGFVGKTGTDDGAKEVRELLGLQGIISELLGEDAEQVTSMAVNLSTKMVSLLAYITAEHLKLLQPKMLIQVMNYLDDAMLYILAALQSNQYYLVSAQSFLAGLPRGVSKFSMTPIDSLLKRH